MAYFGWQARLLPPNQCHIDVVAPLKVEAIWLWIDLGWLAESCVSLKLPTILSALNVQWAGCTEGPIPLLRHKSLFAIVLISNNRTAKLLWKSGLQRRYLFALTMGSVRVQTSHAGSF
jgi:hypothetical protein